MRRLIKPPPVICTVALLCLGLLTSYCAQAQAQTYTWLGAIGQLRVPSARFEDGRQKSFVEECSGTLVTRGNSRHTNTVITAWHCLENYNDLSRSITFTLTTPTGEAITREAYRLANGGGMHGDWAVLRLSSPVPADTITAIQLHPNQADTSRSIIMSGYSHGGQKKGGQRKLRTDEACTITQQRKRVSDTNCIAHKGASGGPAIQLNSQGQPQFCGVISQGDGKGFSTYVPIGSFRSAVEQVLR